MSIKNLKFDQRIKTAIMKEEKKWDSEKIEESPKFKFVITFEGLDDKMNVIEDRHEFIWRPNPMDSSMWSNLEQKIILADLNQNCDDNAKFDEILSRSLPKFLRGDLLDMLRSFGVHNDEIILIKRAWIEVVPGILNFIIIDRTITVDPITSTWELNLETCCREKRGIKCKFFKSDTTLKESAQFKNLSKSALKMSHDELLKYDKEIRESKHWDKAKHDYEKLNGTISLNVHENEFFAENLSSAFIEDFPALRSCLDAKIFESYS